jgi:RNA polymerase sigma-70 factor (ECF subfamily)
VERELNRDRPRRVWKGVVSPEDQDVRDAYAAHAGELYGFAVRCLGDRALAEEAVQETFLRAWRAASRFDPSIGSRRTWLFAIARNVIIDSSRSRAAAQRLDPPVSEPAEDPLEQALLAWQVEEALRRIGEAHREVLLETYFRGRRHGEVAAKLGIPEGTVKSRVFYALRALRNALEEMGYDG